MAHISHPLTVKSWTNVNFSWQITTLQANLVYLIIIIMRILIFHLNLVCSPLTDGAPQTWHIKICRKNSQREILSHLCLFKWVHQESIQRQQALCLCEAISPLFAAQKASRPKSPLLSLSHSCAQPNYLWQWLNLSVLCCEGPTWFNPLRSSSLFERMLCKQCGPLMWGLWGKRAGAEGYGVSRLLGTMAL